jgi:uncharacterized protein (DUF433 family)
MDDQQTYIDKEGRTVYRTEYPHIVKVEGLRGGEAVIEGTGLAVWNIVGYYYKLGMSVDEIVHEWNYLTFAQVLSALAYYHDHKEEIDRVRYENSDDYRPRQRAGAAA